MRLSDASEAQLLALADKVVDGVDNASYGSVVLKAGNIYLTPNSFFAPGTTTPSLQRAVDTAHDVDTVHVGAGAYGAGGTATTTVDHLTVTAPAGATGLALTLGTAVHDITLLGASSIGVTGNELANVITGNSGDDTLNGGAGDDTITGGAGNDTIDGGTGNNTVIFSGNRADYTVSLNGSTYTVSKNAGPDGTDTVTNVQNFQFADGTFSADDVACFMPGTRIAVPGGEASVESLKVGDLVTTTNGHNMPVRWIGRQTVSQRFVDPLRVLPIRIRAGALGENLPVRDLLISPDHAILINDMLVQAGGLVNGMSIVRESNVPMTYTYYHVELDDHSLIIAEGVPAETFVDNINRLEFDNWDEHERALPRRQIDRRNALSPAPRSAAGKCRKRYAPAFAPVA